MNTHTHTHKYEMKMQPKPYILQPTRMVFQMVCTSPNIFKSCDLKAEKKVAAYGTNVGEKKCIRSLKGNPTGIRLFGRPSCRWDNINRLGGSSLFWLKTGTSGGPL